MSKLLSTLIAVVFATVTYSAVAADASTAAAPAATTTTTTTTTVTAAPKKHKKHKMSAKEMKMASCKKDAKAQKVKSADRKSFIKDCMSKEDEPAAKEEAATPAAKK